MTGSRMAMSANPESTVVARMASDARVNDLFLPDLYMETLPASLLVVLDPRPQVQASAPHHQLKVYRSAAVAALVPSGVLTRTWTTAPAWAGVTAVILVGELTVNDGAATPPKLTQWTLLKLKPLIVTVWPPPGGPA